MATEHELYVARGTSLAEPLATSHFRKADAPPTGDRYGAWSQEFVGMRLPGGSVLNFDLSRLTLTDFRQMRENYQINASLLVLLGMFAQADFSVYTEGQEKSASAKKISDTIESIVRAEWMGLVRALGQAHWCGYAPTVLVYDLNPQTKYYEITQYKDLVPEDSRVNWKIKKLPGGVEIRNYNGIINSGKEIPKEVTLWYPMLMENGDYYGRKLLKPAFAPWFFSQLIHLFTNRYFERFGEPVPMGYYPPGETITNTDGSTLSSRDAMINVLTSLRNRGVVALPSDRDPTNGDLEWEIKFLESQMRGADFDRYLDRLDEEMTLSLFTPVLMFRTGDRGSFNLGQIHEKVFSWMINMLAGDAKQYIDNHIIKPLHDINFGPNAPRSEIRFRTLGRLTDQGAQSALQALIQNGGAKLSPLGVQDLGDFLGVDLEYLSGAAGTPPVAPGDQPKPGPDSAASPTPAASGKSQSRVAAANHAREQLMRARSRVEEQVAAAYRRPSHERQRALDSIKLGFKGGYLASMADAGVEASAATEMFSNLEGVIQSAIKHADTEGDAVAAVSDAYAEFGFAA